MTYNQACKTAQRNSHISRTDIFGETRYDTWLVYLNPLDDDDPRPYSACSEVYFPPEPCVDDRHIVAAFFAGEWSD